MGAKPPILFLHGAFAGPEVWTRFVAPWFAARGHAVAAPRLNAAGPGRAPALRDYLRAARVAAERLGGRPVVVGHSLGGLVAQHLAAERRAAGLALVASPGPAGLAPSLWRLALARSEVLAQVLLTQAGAGALLGPRAARRALFTAAASDEWIAAVAPPLLPESPRALLDAFGWDLPFWPFAHGVPTLGLLGSEDAFIPATDLIAIALAYRAETELMPGLAHGMPIDPRWRRLAWRLDAWIADRVAA